MRYRCLPTQRFESGNYALCPIREADIQAIGRWRNEQMDILRQNAPISEADQQRYYDTAIQPTFEQDAPSQILFSYLLDEVCIGYGGLTNIVWPHRRAELSFLLATERTHDLEPYQREFGIYLTLLQQVAFDALGLNRLFSETFDIRPHIVAVLEDKGFRPEGVMKQHVWIAGKPVDALLHGCLRDYLT